MGCAVRYGSGVRWRNARHDNGLERHGLLLTYPLCEIVERVLRPRPGWACALAAVTSGFFEVIEGIVAQIVDPALGAAYLGTQGDVWDAQKDMALAVFGAAGVVLWTMWREKRGEPSADRARH